MDIIVYLRPLIKWWWLLVTATLLAGITSFAVTIRQPKTYQSRTLLMIGRTINDPKPIPGDFYLEQQLAAYYADIADREVVRNDVMKALGISWLPPYTANPLPNTQLIEIAVTDAVPQRAQAVANELAHQLILQTPSSDRPENQNRQGFINEQLNTLQQQIKDTQAEIQKLNLQMGSLNSARQIADNQTQIHSLETKVTTLQSTYASLISTSNQGATNSLSIVEPAGLPSTPIGPNTAIIVLLASAIGLTLACIGAYGIEALDDSIKTADEVTHLFHTPIVGYIPTIRDRENRWDYTYRNPRSPITDGFRMMRTNIEFLGIDEPVKTILITSPGIGEGKSTIAANLAFSYAQQDKQVILVDTDFRRPVLHSAAQTSNDQGLSDLFLGRLAAQDILIPWYNGHVKLLPAGILPPNPTELVGSKKMESIQSDLGKMADLVIFDAPPLILADSLILSKKISCVLLVVRLGITRKSSILSVKKQLEQTGIRIFGIIINQADSGSNYHYNKYYYPSNEDKAKRGKSKSGKTNHKPERSKIPPEQKSNQGTLSGPVSTVSIGNPDDSDGFGYLQAPAISYAESDLKDGTLDPPVTSIETGGASGSGS